MSDDTLLQVLLLGMLEGLTEFLPVSSTGHLILGAELLGFDEGAAGQSFKIVVQLGAILAVLWLYRARFAGVIAGLPRDPAARHFALAVGLGFVPAMIIGALFYDAFKTALEYPKPVAVALIVGGVAMLVIERMVKRVRVRSVETMPPAIALGIGLVQCIAMIPGVSRSGASIMGALLMGVERRTAAEFSFFLAIPTMIGATVYDLYKTGPALGADDLRMIAVGFLAAFVTAMAGVRLLVGLVSRHGFAPFAWYRIAVGAVALVWLTARDAGFAERLLN